MSESNPTSADQTARLTLDKITALTGFTKRTVRFYIQKGLVDRPEGETRAAFYTDAHLRQLLEIKRWQAAGLSLERIRELLHGMDEGTPPEPKPVPGSVHVVSRVLLADGLTLEIDPQVAQLTPEARRDLIAAILSSVEQLSKGTDS